MKKSYFTSSAAVRSPVITVIKTDLILRLKSVISINLLSKRLLPHRLTQVKTVLILKHTYETMSTYTLLDDTIQETSFQESFALESYAQEIHAKKQFSKANSAPGEMLTPKNKKSIFEKYNDLKVAYIKVRARSKFYKNKIEDLEHAKREADDQLLMANSEILRLRADMKPVKNKRKLRNFVLGNVVKGKGLF